MHRDIVPTHQQLTGPERTIRLLPSRKQVCNNPDQDIIQFRESTVQENGEVDTLRIIIELSSINCESGWFRKRYG
jgi:hypothetical protein